jgi:hypothetical protein
MAEEGQNGKDFLALLLFFITNTAGKQRESSFVLPPPPYLTADGRLYQPSAIILSF